MEATSFKFIYKIFNLNLNWLTSLPLPLMTMQMMEDEDDDKDDDSRIAGSVHSDEFRMKRQDFDFMSTKIYLALELDSKSLTKCMSICRRQSFRAHVTRKSHERKLLQNAVA